MPMQRLLWGQPPSLAAEIANQPLLVGILSGHKDGIFEQPRDLVARAGAPMAAERQSARRQSAGARQRMTTATRLSFGVSTTTLLSGETK